MKKFSSADENYDWFKDNLNELVKNYDGQYLVIQNQNIIAAYPSFDEAFVKTSETEIPNTFIIQLCSLDKEKTGQTFFTNRVSFHE